MELTTGRQHCDLEARCDHSLRHCVGHSERFLGRENYRHSSVSVRHCWFTAGFEEAQIRPVAHWIREQSLSLAIWIQSVIQNSWAFGAYGAAHLRFIAETAVAGFCMCCNVRPQFLVLYSWSHSQVGHPFWMLRGGYYRAMEMVNFGDCRALKTPKNR